MAMNLDLLRVELATDYFDREYASDLLSRYHPLGERKVIGKRLCYIVKYRGRECAVLLFDNAVKRNKLRERKIGWSSEQVLERLKHVSNNTRFLILPEYCGEKNLASKVLSLVSERISNDWYKRYHTPLLALETYVDPKHNDNQGSCYLAAGWENLGYSSGYQAPNEERTHSKWYFIKPLHTESFSALASPFGHTLLTGVKKVSKESNNQFAFNWSEVKLKELQKHLSVLKDPRTNHGKIYAFTPLLTLCIAAVFSGYTQYRQIADWISQLPVEIRSSFGLRPDRVPTEATIGNFLSRIEPVPLENVLKQYLEKHYKNSLSSQKIVSIDGKNLRGTSSLTKEQAAFLNVFDNSNKVVLEQIPTKKGGGEKSTARKALKNNSQLRNKVILADAIHTDQKFIKTALKKSAIMSSLSKIIKNI